MSKQSFCDKERNRIEKMNKFQLAYKYKRVGIIIAITAFSLMIAKKFIDEPDWVKPILSNLLLIGFLIISISKDKIEDEYIDSLRAQSYRLAFILSVIYSLIQPLVNYGVDFLLNEEPKAFYDFDYFQVLFFMLVVQIMFFTQMKRYNS
tara:strand:- start:167 stop:613 length:447 start_codon:yes stop_codon:yes gene_type:complete